MEGISFALFVASGVLALLLLGLLIYESIKENDQMREIWKLVKEFKMTDKVTFYAYERIKEFDQEEANYWIELFQEESKEYPHLFSERIKLYTEVMSNKAK